MDKLSSLLYLLDTKLAENIRILDVRKRCFFTDYFILLTAKNTRHLKSLLTLSEAELSKYTHHFHHEGDDHSTWLLLDAHGFIVHFFLAESREMYHLESLWADCPSYTLEEFIRLNNN